MCSIDIPQSPGIYKIYFLDPDLIYIGSAVNLRKRYGTHVSDLRKDKHGNSHLQHAYAKYGIDALHFEIVELVECKEALIEREQYYIDLMKPRYNIHPNARSALGVKRSPEHIAKLSVSHKGQPAWNKGKPPLPETRAKMSVAKLGKPSPIKGEPRSPELKEQMVTKYRATIDAKGGLVSPRKGVTLLPETKDKIRTTLLNKSPEEKAQIRERRRATSLNRTSEEKAQIVEKRRATIAAKGGLPSPQKGIPYSSERREQVTARFHATMAAKTPEERAQRLEKWRVSMAARKSLKQAETSWQQVSWKQASLWDDETAS